MRGSGAAVFDGFPTPPCAQTLGWRLIHADAESGSVRGGFTAPEAFCNPGGKVQGGFVAAMLDDTLGPTVLGRIDIQEMASRKWWFRVTRSAGYFQYVSTGSARNRRLQAARTECRSAPVKSGGAAYGATIDLNVQFLAPAMPGRFEGEGRLVQLGKSVAFLAGELRDASGTLVATATASARVVPTAALARR